MGLETDKISNNPISVRQVTKWFKIIGLLGGVLGAMLLTWTIFGEIYAIPKTVKQHDETLNVHSTKLDSQAKDISSLKEISTIDRHTINGMQRTLEEVNAKQSIMSKQSAEINKTLTELNTTLKFFGESIKELKQDVKEIKDKR